MGVVVGAATRHGEGRGGLPASAPTRSGTLGRAARGPFSRLREPFHGRDARDGPDDDRGRRRIPSPLPGRHPRATREVSAGRRLAEEIRHGRQPVAGTAEDTGHTGPARRADRVAGWAAWGPAARWRQARCGGPETMGAGERHLRGGETALVGPGARGGRPGGRLAARRGYARGPCRLRSYQAR